MNKYYQDSDELMEHYNFYVEDEEENRNKPLSYDEWSREYVGIKFLPSKDYKITISWNVEDVLSIDDTLTIDQCIDVLDLARHNHDANYGITWDTLASYIDDVKEDSKPIIAGVDFTDSLNLLNKL